jgi:hypothetical protein
MMMTWIKRLFAPQKKEPAMLEDNIKESKYDCMLCAYPGGECVDINKCKYYDPNYQR